ncbi:15-hydroxyprostaglandin dehydrogenase [NAD(+)]-like [Aulostomus maculatus]
MALSGKTAVVTGAAMGIGKAITEILLQNGAKVVLLDVNESAGRSLKEALDQQYGGERTVFMSCDVASEQQTKGDNTYTHTHTHTHTLTSLYLYLCEDFHYRNPFPNKVLAWNVTQNLHNSLCSFLLSQAAFQKTVETFGGIDILCNNAGIMNEKAWEEMVSINLVAVIKVSYLALEHMNKLSGGRGGVIVHTASLAGFIPMKSCPVYTASKHAVVGFTRAMAAACSASGYHVRFNALCPGFVKTDLIPTDFDKFGQFSHLADEIQKYQGTGGQLDASVVAKSFLELVTDETKNGEALLVTSKYKRYMAFPNLTQQQ